MDIKGAYLNGILQEKVYMRQPEGYDDGTSRVCELVKTLYGLKQSGCEWNKEFDKKIRSFVLNLIHVFIFEGIQMESLLLQFGSMTYFFLLHRNN